ncbi:hypothetical protein SAMN05446037_100193 [Anaerovirgula multivorans]|uniref:Prepilin-type N-terminal cleavage/methylation domain-containing protein n=1 Tax=Anaerovirgula multivorans TaxID=312168 RepID=A0A238ZUV2_9FIRM|nr:hypothetical protein [Anaerovirgula multivorans]SNR86443.1 hypothetical protein SAMN05446037_100193 [Anaerovirgula multivorans]
MLNKKIYELLSSKKGVTLIEILISLIIFIIIIVPFLGMFVQSTKSNSLSQNIIDATYIAQSCMEDVYSISITNNFMDGLTELKDNGFTETVVVADEDYDYTKNIDGYYALIEIRKSAYSGNLVKVVAKIYNNSALEKLEAQMETILLWNS